MLTLKSVSERQRLCEGLERKLAAQKSIEQAAEEMGLSVKEAEDLLDAVRVSRAKTVDDQLEHFAAEALKTALSTLKKAARDGNREMGEGMGDGMYRTEAAVDIDAAKALLRAGLDAQKILDRRREKAASRAKAAGGSGLVDPTTGRDLFDRSNPWKFKPKD